MGLTRLCLAYGAFIGSLPTLAQAQTSTPPPYRTVRHDEDYSYLADPVRRTDWLDPIKHMSLGRPGWYLSLGGELRERFELFKNTDWKPAPADGFLLQKYMLHAELHLGPRLRAFASLKSGLESGRTGGPRPTDEDRLDLHEAFVDVVLDAGHAGVLRLGRREMAFGSQRLVSVRAGPNVRQTFDGISLLVAPGAWTLEAFVTKPAKTLVGVFDDNPDRARTFWGVHAVGPLRLFAQAGIDLYYLGLDRKQARFEQGTASEFRDTVGTRIWRRAAPWDYNFELVYQWGRFGSSRMPL